MFSLWHITNTFKKTKMSIPRTFLTAAIFIPFLNLWFLDAIQFVVDHLNYSITSFYLYMLSNDLFVRTDDYFHFDCWLFDIWSMTSIISIIIWLTSNDIKMIFDRYCKWLSLFQEAANYKRSNYWASKCDENCAMNFLNHVM